MKMKKKKRSAGGKKGSRTWAYPVEFRLRIVKLFLCFITSSNDNNTLKP